MFTLRCTARLLKRLDVPLAPLPPAPTTRLGDWHANLVHVGRQQLVLAVADKTLLPVLVPAAPKGSLLERMRVALVRQLSNLDVPRDAIDAEDAATAEVVYGKAASRQVLGILVDFARLVPYYLEDGSSLEDAERKLIQTPCGPLYKTPTSSPDLATAALFGIEQVWRPGWPKAVIVRP